MTNEITPVIQDDEIHFPDRELAPVEMKLILAQIIKYSAGMLAATLPPNDQLQSKIADHNINRRMIQHCPDEIIGDVFLDIGAFVRKTVTHNPVVIGLTVLPPHEKSN